MTTKAELIARMEALLQQEDLEQTADQVEAVDQGLEVAEDLGLTGEAPGPVPLGREREAVQVAGDVAGRARVGVVTPGAAEAVGGVAVVANLARSVALPGWQRYWVLDHHGSIVGHADLTGGRFRSELHVARFGIAIRRAHWHRGHGHRLMEEAITWAWSRPEIHRIELTVFAQNRRAQALYRRLGFVEEGRARRRFRLQDHWVDDISMALLRPESAEAPTQPKNP